MVILDTNIIIDHVRRKDSRSYLERLVETVSEKDCALSVISIQELYEGSSTRDTAKENYLLTTISPLTIVSYTYDIAQRAGKIARDIKRPIALADAAIAATAIIHESVLVTLNKKDFSNIPGLELYKLI